MDEKYSDNMYVFWVKTGREEIAIRQIKTVFGDDVVFLKLMVETFFRKQGKVIKICRCAFPGYVFVLTNIENEEFIFRAKECARFYLSILKLLRYINTYQAALHEEERKLIDYLWQGKMCIETSIGFFEGDRIIVIDGPLKGRESVIRKIYPRKRQAVVEVEFMGRKINTIVGLEIVDKLP